MRDHSMSIVATFAHEWRQQIYSGRTFIFQACLLLALSVAVFLVGGLFDSDYASFDLVWSFLPAIAIVLVPAFGARAFAQEDGSRELELLLTLPLSDTGIVIGKWLSGTAFLALTLCCAAPIAITIGYLGAPDWGAAAAGAVGAVLMLATLYAVAMFCSAVTGEQTSAYVLAVVALMALTAMGWETAVARNSCLCRRPSSIP